MAKILVTGGAGYIGSHTCKALAAAGHIPVTYDNLTTGVASAVKWGPLELGDVADRTRLLDVITNHQPEAVLHFAAHIKVGESVLCPDKYYWNNVAATLTLLDAVRAVGIRFFVFSSSAAVYATPSGSSVTEDDKLRPNNPYGRSKQMVEAILNSFGEAYDLKWIALRYFNAAGADPDGEIGLNDPDAESLVPSVMRSSFDPQSEFEIFGVDYDTPDGTGIRDFVHVTDLAAAHVLALEYLQRGGSPGPFNLGAESGYSVRQVVRMAEEILRHPIHVKDAARRSGDLPAMIADSKKARTLLNWIPKHSSLREIISSAVQWERNRNSN